MEDVCLGVRAAARPVAECYAAVCSGTARLTALVGHPVVHVGIAEDARAAVEVLNRTRHGCGALWPGSFQPLQPQPGWDDWALFPLELEEVGARPPFGLSIEGGLIRVPLPARTPIVEFAEQVSAGLRHLRYQDVVLRPAWLEACSEAREDIIEVPPRYTLPRYPDFRGARIVTDLVTLDPTAAAESCLLFWLVVAARLSVNEGRAT